MLPEERISIGTVIASGAAGSAVAMPVVLLGVIGGSLWGANAATSREKRARYSASKLFKYKGLQSLQIRINKHTY